MERQRAACHRHGMDATRESICTLQSNSGLGRLIDLSQCGSEFVSQQTYWCLAVSVGFRHVHVKLPRQLSTRLTENVKEIGFVMFKGAALNTTSKSDGSDASEVG